MTTESLNKTWFIDIDGTIVKHSSNDEIDEAIVSDGNRSYLMEEPIERSVEFLKNIPKDATIILTTARDKRHEQHTLKMLEHFEIRYDKIIFDLRAGPRYLINDIKPIGVAKNSKPLNTAFAVNVERDKGIIQDKLCL